MLVDGAAGRVLHHNGSVSGYRVGNGSRPRPAARAWRLIGLAAGIDQEEHDHVHDHAEEEHPAHHALLQAGVTIVEGLYLVDVPPGDYTFFCGPLRILGAEGAPARAFLTT